MLADLELMPLALDYQRRAHEAADGRRRRPRRARARTTATPTCSSPPTATRLGELCAELGEGLLDDGVPESAAPHFAEARAAGRAGAASCCPPDAPGVVAAQVVHGWALVGLGEHAAADRAAARRRPHHLGHRRPRPAAPPRSWRWAGRCAGRATSARADEHLVSALTLATEHGLPRLRRAALRELCTLHAELDDAGRALPYLQAYLADELDRVDERRTRWVELFGRRKSLLETERAAGQLRRQAYEDPLTHLPNRRYAEARLDGLLVARRPPRRWPSSTSTGSSRSTTRSATPAATRCCARSAELLVAGVRDTDEVCRWAGDEFVILLPDTTAEQAERALERTRRKVAAYDWAALGLDVPVTISVGIASAARGDDRRTLFAAADGVLYDAKRSGRDRVVRLSGVTQTRGRRAARSTALVRSAAERRRRADGPPTTTRRRASPTSPPAGRRSPTRRRLRPAARRAAPGRPAAGPRQRHRAAARPGAGRRRPVAAPVRPPAVPAGARGRLGAPAARPSRCWRWSARRAASTPTARRWCCAPPPTRSSPLAAEHDAYTTMDAAAMAAAVGPLPEPVGRVRVLCAGGGDTPVAAEAAFVARVDRHRGRARRRRRRQPDPRAAHRRHRCSTTSTAWSSSPAWTPRWPRRSAR